MNKVVPLPQPRDTKYGVMRAEAFIGDASLPASSDVVIIGGGIMGITTAYYLAKQGVSVLLCEKAELACEASGRALGWIMEQLADPLKLPLAQISKRLWTEIQANAGEVGYRPHGLAYFAESDDDMAMYRGWLDGVGGSAATDARLLTADQVTAQFPTASRRFAGALFSPTDGSIEPTIAAVRIAKAARQAGVRIVTDCAVRGVDIQNGSVKGIYTEKGYVSSSTVVSAANCWTRRLLGNHGVDVPQIYVFMSAGRTTETAGPAGSGGSHNFAWRHQIDGTYSLGGLFGVKAPATYDAFKLRKMYKPLMDMMGGGKVDFGRNAWTDLTLPRRWSPKGPSPFEKVRVLASPAENVALQSLANNIAVFPEMANAKTAEMWSGPISLTPDNKPIIGPVDSIKGLHVISACAFGMTWGPAVGASMAAMVTGKAPLVDMHPFRLSRFSDGSPLEVSH